MSSLVILPLVFAEERDKCQILEQGALAQQALGLHFPTLKHGCASRKWAEDAPPFCCQKLDLCLKGQISDHHVWPSSVPISHYTVPHSFSADLRSQIEAARIRGLKVSLVPPWNEAVVPGARLCSADRSVLYFRTCWYSGFNAAWQLT